MHLSFVHNYSNTLVIQILLLTVPSFISPLFCLDKKIRLSLPLFGWPIQNTVFVKIKHSAKYVPIKRVQ